MRLVFIVYAINSAAVCFLLTFAISFLPEPLQPKLALAILYYTYAVFGPLLLICCFFGIFNLNSLVFECEFDRVTSWPNFLNIFVLLGAILLSSLMTFLCSAHKTVEYVQDSLREEDSIIFRIYFKLIT